MVKDYLHNQKVTEKTVHTEMIVLAMRSVADTCIIPIQDYFGYDNSARMNHPSTTGSNWKWRLTEGEITEEMLKEIGELTRIYGRYNFKPEPEAEEEESDVEETADEEETVNADITAANKVKISEETAGV